MNCDFTNLSGLLELFKNANKMLLDLSHFDTSNQEVFYDFIEELKSRLCDGPILESFDEHSVIWYGTEIGQKVFYKTDPRILDIAWKNYKIAYLWLEQMKVDYINHKRKYDLIESNDCEMKVDSLNLPSTNNLDKCEIKHIMNINNYQTKLETI